MASSSSTENKGEQSSPKRGRTSKASRKPRAPTDSKTSPNQKHETRKSGAVARPLGRALSTSKRATQSRKTETLPKTNSKPETRNPELPQTGPNGYPVHSTSKLGKLFELNRSTVAKRLQERGVKPVVSGERKADYELTPEVEAILGSSFTDPEVKEAQRRTAIINSRLKEIELAEAEKRSIPRDEMFEEISAIFRSLYQQFVLQMPRANRARYAKISNAAEIEKALKADNAKPFLQLRANYNEIFKSKSQKPDRQGGRGT